MRCRALRPASTVALRAVVKNDLGGVVLGVHLVQDGQGASATAGGRSARASRRRAGHGAGAQKRGIPAALEVDVEVARLEDHEHVAEVCPAETRMKVRLGA